MAEKPTNKERLREITDGIEQGIEELFQSEKYMRYLSVMSRFHCYSVNNTMLIYMQKPDATLVAGYNKWKDRFERHVKKGEHGITIIVPTPFKKKIEVQKLDTETKAAMLDKDGKAITEEKEIEIPMFRPVKVFDVSQTDGKPLPELAANLSGNVQNFDVFMEALRRSAPVPIELEAMAENMDGYFSAENQRIAIRQGMSEVQTVSAAVHEIAHSKLHNLKLPEEGMLTLSQFLQEQKKDRHTEEVEAESISYAVCQYYGIQTGENSFGYIASWSQGKELKELRASLEIINKTAGELISSIDQNYREICKERGIDLTDKQEPEASSVEQTEPDAPEQTLDEYPMPDQTVSVSDMQEYGYLYDGMLPLSHERALELDAAGLTVYVLHKDNTESMVFDTEEIMAHDGLFGVDHEEWEHSPQFHEKVLERQEHQHEREQAFLAHVGDCFAIYQVKHTDELRDIRYEGVDWLKSIGQMVKHENYDLIYTAPLDTGGGLEKLYEKFNINHPVDYHSPSMSVSDIVAIKQDGKVSCHYCDSVGFAEVTGFLPDNPLKNAEMAVEDDYGMIDGIINNGAKEPTVAELEQQARSGQPISLMDLAAATHREERDKKKSVVEQLKSQPKPEHKKTAPQKSAEREIRYGKLHL